MLYDSCRVNMPELWEKRDGKHDISWTREYDEFVVVAESRMIR